MDRNIGFFDAWRAKRREKKNEESERSSASKAESGMLSKYLKMRNPEMLMIEKKSEVEEGLNKVTENISAATNEVTTLSYCNDVEKKAVSSIETSKKETEILGNDLPENTKASLKTFSQNRKTSLSNTPAGSRKSSFDSNSRRGSILSPLNSFSNIQERILTLSQEHFQNDSAQKKPIKVNKLSKEALKIGHEPLRIGEESMKGYPKVNSNLQAKLTKFEIGKTESIASKKISEENTQKAIVKKKIAFVNTNVLIKEESAKNLEKMNDFAIKEEVQNSQKPLLIEEKQLGNPETSAKDFNGTSAKMETRTQKTAVECLNSKDLSLEKSSLNASTESKNLAPRLSQEEMTKRKENSNAKSESRFVESRAPRKETKSDASSKINPEVQLIKSESPSEAITNVDKNTETNSSSVVSREEVKCEIVNVDCSTKTCEEPNKAKLEKKLTKKIDGYDKLQSEVTKVKAQKVTRNEEIIKIESPKITSEGGKRISASSVVKSQSKTETVTGDLKKNLANSDLLAKPSQKGLKEFKRTSVKAEVLKNESQKELTKKFDEKTELELETGKRSASTDLKVKNCKKTQQSNSEGTEKAKENHELTKLKPKESAVDIKASKNNESMKLVDEVIKKEGKPSYSSEGLKSQPQPLKFEILQTELIKEAVKLQEGMTVLTNRAKQMGCESPETSLIGSDDKSEIFCFNQGSESETLSFRKDPKKLEKKLKSKSEPNECYPKTQKLLITKPVNAFEQVKLEESKSETVVSPTKVEAFLREALNPPTISGEKEPVKTVEAVVEEILTSTSEKSKHEKPSKIRYTSRGEVICGVVSIKPNKEENADSLSAITLVPAFRPEKYILDENGKERINCSGSSCRENSKTMENSKSEERLHGSPDDNRRDCFSPTISDFSDDSFDHYVASVDYSLDSSYSRRRSLRSSSTPRRIFPQIVKPSPYRTDRTKEESPIVFDAGLSFDIASNRTSLHHRFKPQPAFTEMKTTSNLLSVRISDFLKRTDHIMEEWKHLGKGGEDLQSLVKLPSRNVCGRVCSTGKSATNIMIKGLLNYSKGSRTPSMRSKSLAKTSETSDRTISDIDELSEMTLDLSEERATGTMQAERLEAETAERVRLEQELSQVQNEKKNLQQTSERLEMELFYARADVNGLSESEADLEDGGGDAALYKNKCERAMRELEFTRRRLQQQHEDDLEQLVALKKQLEKKLADAYEEVEEQRQVAAQWKRKVQKLQSEANDLRLLLEEQSSRNNLLEKKQRKFDSEIQLLQEELRSERNQKERLSREKEMAIAEKYSLEQNLSSVRLELELKEEKVSALTRELEELSRGGGTEQEVTQLRKAKHDLEMKLKEQEEELDELAGQVSMLEGNKLRLEMSLESLRKEHRREMAQRDDELDEVRANAQKKIKVLESQLESEHEERTLLVREKHELERRLADAEERGRHHRAADEDALQRARRDLKKTKALLRDAQVMLERAKQDSPTKAALRALKNQLEDAELARASAVKSKQSLEAELNEVTGQLEEALRAKGDSENRCQAAVREMNSLRTQVDENEEELAELLKKYRQTVQQLSAEQLASQETASTLAEVEAERASLRDQLAELTARLEANAVVDPISGLAQKKLEIRIKELESRLELEQTTRGRLEVQIARLKENVERLNDECVQARTKEQAATDLSRKLQRSLREVKEELAAQQAKEQEAAHKRKELEKRLEAAEAEASTARTDLRLAVKRIEDLQSAISGEIGSDSERTESDEEDSENDSLVSHVPSTLSSASRTSRTPELTPR